MKKVLLIEKRKKAIEFHEKKGWGVRKIARYLLASKNSVCKWVKTCEGELLRDNRGWEKGKPRKYTSEQKEEIKNIRKKLEKEESFFIGSKVVQANYNNSHKTKLSKDFVDRTLKEYKMVNSPQEKRKGLSKYMQYPQRTLNKLGKSMMSIDFIISLADARSKLAYAIGPKYLKGSSDRINFLSCKYILSPRKRGDCSTSGRSDHG